MSTQVKVRSWSSALAVLLTGAALVTVQAQAQAAPPGAETEPVTGTATWFDNLGAPYGGCGLPQDRLETQSWIALNVYDTPGDYAMYPRPMGDDDPKVGMFDNGRNCGRWVRVSVDDYCTGVNDGAAGQDFCRGGTWVEDEYSGATLDMLVADSCGDPDAWCRDDPYHLDLAHAAINTFVKDGAWVTTPMNTDMGQSYLVKPTTSGGTDYRIRVKDVTGAYVFGGREYAFSLPASCDGKCAAPRTVVPYTTSHGDGSTPTATPTTGPTDEPTATPTATAGPTEGPTTCTAAFRAVSAWPGGYQGEVTVTADAAVTSWTVTMSGASVASLWNGVATGTGPDVTVANAPYNGSLAAGATTSFGFIGAGSPAPRLTCST